MKRTNTKLKLKQRLELVRMTVRALTPEDLRAVNGGNTEEMITVFDCPTKCCIYTSDVSTP